MRRAKNTGFTIVELLIVIAVIAILAAITIVSYNSVQRRGQDVRRVSDVTTLRDAISIWSLKTQTMPENSGSGYNANGFGWVSSNSYPLSLENMLIEGGYIPGEIRDPVTPLGNGSYMFYRCGTSTLYERNRIYGIFAKMDNPGQNGNEVDQWNALGCATGMMTAYGVNYVVMLKL